MRSQHFCQKYEKITSYNGKTSNTSPNTYDPQTLTSCPQQTADSDRRIRQLRWIPKHVNGPGVLWWAMRDFSLMLSVTYEKESWGYRRKHKGNLSSWLERDSNYLLPKDSTNSTPLLRRKHTGMPLNHQVTSAAQPFLQQGEKWSLAHDASLPWDVSRHPLQSSPAKGSDSRGE